MDTYMDNQVLLRDVLDADLPIFFEQQNDSVANEMAAFQARDRDAFMAHWAKIRLNERNRMQTILYNGQVAGNMLSFDMGDKREVGYWLGRDFWGKGIASQALREFLKQETTRPLYGYTVKHNIGSRRVLEKCGFEFIGEEEQYVILVLK
jgi:RimJ/RimL family protein N-acetyltransferase